MMRARGLIFTANGGGYGSVTIVRQHLTDSYSMIQNLPTLQQARTMAIDPSTGLVYLVTTLYGAKLDQSADERHWHTASESRWTAVSRYW